MDKTKEIIEILKGAEQGMGAYSRDQLTHANNTIESMKELINKALEKLK